MRGDPGRAAVACSPPGRDALNQALGNVGKTVVYTETVNPLPAIQVADLKALVADMNAGKVQWLVMLDANPVYSAPADLNFADAFNKVPNERAPGHPCGRDGADRDWHINSAHYLESWSDARAYDGTISIVQPMIDPLYGGKRRTMCSRRCLTIRRVRAYDAVQDELAAAASGKGDFEPAGARRCTTAGSRARRSRRKRSRLALRRGIGGSAPAAPMTRLRSSSGPIRRSMTALLERRLAAGAAQAGHEQLSWDNAVADERCPPR